MAIENLTPDIGSGPNELCANRKYLFNQAEFALTYEWIAISGPGAVNLSDVIFTSKHDKDTYVEVPLAGEYCFITRMGNAP